MPSSSRDHDAPSGSRREKDDSHRSKHSRASPERRDRHKYRDRDETEEERRERKRAKREDRDGKDRKGKKEKREKNGVDVVDDDEGMWVEKGVEGDPTANIPSSDTLALKSNPSEPTSAALPSTTHSGSNERDSWMLEPDAAPTTTAPPRDIPHSASIDTDFFSSFGTEHKRKEAEAPVPSTNYRELNTQLREGKKLDEYETVERKKTGAGGPGWQFRMRKLARLVEQAAEMQRPVEEVALERYGNIEEYNEAVEERRVLDERDSRRLSRRGTDTTPVGTPDGRRFMFADDSRPGSRAGFRRPGEEGASTPGGRMEQLRKAPKVSTPIPSVFTPQSLQRQGSYFSSAQLDMSTPVLTLEQLNKLQAGVLRAKLMDDDKAGEREEEYEYERLRYEASLAPPPTKVTEVLPTLDGAGRLYDIGTGGVEEERRPGNRRKKEQKGNLIRYNADDDDQTLGELVRQERFGAGSAEQKSLDAAMAGAIAGDARYQDDLDYIDENAERLARRKMKSDAMKRQFAINDFARTKKSLDECVFCHQEDRNPLTAIVALGTRVYMSCTLTEELVPGHCLIVPIQHHLSTLELEDDDWEEIRNFMKCLMRMYAKENKGVIFFETVPSFRQQRHTFIEAVPVPFELFQDCPAYFRESILSSESEWSQHKKLIDFSTRPGGFRRALVANLPYFMVQWDYKGEKGYGHIIEGDDDNAGRGGGDDGEGAVYEGDKGGSGFPAYFAAEVIGNVLGLEPRKWMKPKKLDFGLNQERARALGTKFQPYNWTMELQK